MFSYEEIRVAVVNVLLGIGDFSRYGRPRQWADLTAAVARALTPPSCSGNVSVYTDPRLRDADAELVRDVFWDLFRQGYITLGINDANANWPFFRLSYFGEKALVDGLPYRFTDTTSYLAMVRDQVPSLNELTAAYLEEAAQSFYAGCFLAASVMLGVAAENMFVEFLSAIGRMPAYESNFRSTIDARTILKKVKEFQRCLPAHMPNFSPDLREDLDSHLNFIQAVLRSSRNDAGHPTGKRPTREVCYVNLQLFAPFGSKLSQLQTFFCTTAD